MPLAPKTSGRILRPTQVVIFGSPKSGTPLMQMSETIGIDLPLKMLVRQEGERPDGSRLRRSGLAREPGHGLAAAAGPIVEKMQVAMAAIAGEAAAGSS